jgi:hypothetical protein
MHGNDRVCEVLCGRWLPCVEEGGKGVSLPPRYLAAQRRGMELACGAAKLVAAGWGVSDVVCVFVLSP